MTTYLYASLTIEDPEAVAAYRAVAKDALAKHGGSLVAAGGAPERLEGKPPPAQAVALIAFPSPDAARAWHGDPDLAEVHALRNRAGSSTIVIVPAP